jgi:hypothetical protein
VACDGPNPERPGEAEKVASTRAVIEHEIDWPCQIERLYSDVNQGCRWGVSRATMLERYRHDTRLWCISGNNFQNGQ